MPSLFDISIQRTDITAGCVAGYSADPALLPRKATTMDLQQFGHRDTQQR
jgi:hypothetical protein